MNATALLIDDPVFDEHRAQEPHPERPERLHAARRAVAQVATQLPLRAIPARDARDSELERVHGPEYIRSLGRSAGRWTMLDADTYSGPRSVAAARRAAGAGVVLADALVQRSARFGVALVRPPGHHARPDSAMGFCLLNNVAIAAAHARSMGVERVLILDFDVHHGNGTQEMFYADPHVLFVSLHQFPYYPGTGTAEELGSGEGQGYTVNVPLSAGAGDAVYGAALERIVVPIIEQYRPELALVSAGFDAHMRDPLGGMTLTDDGYARLTRQLLGALAPECPVGFVLEGGYDLAGLQSALEATLEALTGSSAGPALAGSELRAPHTLELARIQALLRRHWLLD